MKEFALGFAHTNGICFFLCLFFSLLHIFLPTQKIHLLLALNMLAHTFIPRQAFDEKKDTHKKHEQTNKRTNKNTIENE